MTAHLPRSDNGDTRLDGTGHSFVYFTLNADNLTEADKMGS